MFKSNKDDFKRIYRRLADVEDQFRENLTYKNRNDLVIQGTLDRLTEENDRLKAILGELCDYVYKDGK